MREGISNNASGTSSRIVWSSAIVVTIGISILLFAGEWFAAFDACVCEPDLQRGGSAFHAGDLPRAHGRGGRSLGVWSDHRAGARQGLAVMCDDPLVVI